MQVTNAKKPCTSASKAAKPKSNPSQDPQSVAAKVCFKPKLNCVWYVPCFDWKLRKLKNMRFNADRMFIEYRSERKEKWQNYMPITIILYNI